MLTKERSVLGRLTLDFLAELKQAGMKVLLKWLSQLKFEFKYHKMNKKYQMPLDEEDDQKFDYDEEVDNDSNNNYSEDQQNNQNEYEDDGQELVPGINDMQNEDMSDSDNAQEE